MLSNIGTKEQLAKALGVSFQKHLVYYLHRLPSAARYKPFEIKKRSGGVRQIKAPHYGLKAVQKRLATLLLNSYGARKGIHGYVKGRSPATNADEHVGQQFVLNIDLQDFFASINFGRVRGIMASSMYGANAEVATVIAQIACFENALPQGAPTSPIISNMVCGAMDAELKRFAQRNRCRYTRYSDDITLSCGAKSFPSSVAVVQGAKPDRKVNLSEELLTIISKHGFTINNTKTRLLTKSDRQEVTGLVVNRFVNVPRKYVRNLWSALHAWRKYGYDRASQSFREKFDHRTRGNVDFESVIFGRVQYVGSIRGFEDELYLKLRRAFNQLSSKQIPIHGSTWEHALENGIWIVEYLYDEEGRDEPVGAQGTGFFLNGVGLVTCAHCLGEKGNYAFHPSRPSLSYEFEVIARDDTIDLAVLRLRNFSGAEPPVFQAASDSLHIERRDRITLAGWPKYGPGSTLSVKEGQVQSIQMKSGIRRFNISTPVIEGNSGGPVFNSRRQVIGVAATGARSASDEGGVEAHGVIPIAALSYLLKS